MDVEHGDLEHQIYKVHVRLYELDCELAIDPTAQLHAERSRLQRDFDLLRDRIAAATVQHVHHHYANVPSPQSFLGSFFSRH